jgi:hypothetical protein
VSVTGEPPSAVEEDEEDTTNKVEVIPEVIEPLPLLDVLRISAVLEDAMDQLSILNYIMPLQFERKQSTSLVSTLTTISFCFLSFLSIIYSTCVIKFNLRNSTFISDERPP